MGPGDGEGIGDVAVNPGAKSGGGLGGGGGWKPVCDGDGKEPKQPQTNSACSRVGVGWNGQKPWPPKKNNKFFQK